MENTILLLKSFFEENNWKYEYVENNKLRLFKSGINMNNILGVLLINIYVRENSYTVSVVLNSRVTKEYYSDMAEYLHRANFGLRNGNFEFDYEDGEVRYKTYVGFEGVQLSPNIIEDSIMEAIFTVDMYGENLFKVMLGSGTPELLIKEVEETDDIVESQTNE